MLNDKYDIIVVGAGHAGCEAAIAAAKSGSQVLLITMNMWHIAQLSCNPSVGGIGKGQLIREIDALGGLSGIITDKSMIQFRMLNRSKGPAMWSPRSQNDRFLFTYYWRIQLEQYKNISLFQDNVCSLYFNNGKLSGIKTQLNYTFESKAVILTNGTFLNGEIFIGKTKLFGGRINEENSQGLTKQLISLGIKSERFKTGTSARLDGRTINFDVMEIQNGDEYPQKFSFSDETTPLKKQKPCFITRTNEIVHDILKSGFIDSPLFKGTIGGLGPRYCPSIEDKLNKFSDKNSHQLFIEPEGWDTIEYYINGYSSSLPEDIQLQGLQKIKGLEHVKIFRPGYAIGYDFFVPTQLQNTLETKQIENLYFAGQINGTTGYEEAAAQGLIAAINAHNKINNLPKFELKRTEAYIGVLIDDLITKGVDEPYRLFTSRAEHRILLRQDNADFRLTEKGYNLGLISENRYIYTKNKYKSINDSINNIKKTSIAPTAINSFLKNKNSSLLKQKIKWYDLILRPEIKLQELIDISEQLKKLINNNNFIEEIELLIKYENYINKELDIAKKIQKNDNIPLHPDFDYFKLKSISYEAREKLKKIKPTSIGQASRISGVSPADIAVLLTYFNKI